MTICNFLSFFSEDTTLVVSVVTVLHGLTCASGMCFSPFFLRTTSRCRIKTILDTRPLSTIFTDARSTLSADTLRAVAETVGDVLLFSSEAP